MPKILSASIPKNICYVYANKQEMFPIGCSWDIDFIDGSFQSDNSKQLYFASCADADQPSSMKYSEYIIKYHYRSNSSALTKDVVINKDIVPNSYIKNIKILSSHKAENGYVAFKASIDDKYCVDVGVDTLTDCVINTNINPGANIDGEFLWIKKQGLYLIRAGSTVHNLVLEYENKKTLKKIPKRKLEPGAIYQTLLKKRAIFIGYIDSILMKSKRNAYNRYGACLTKSDFNFNHDYNLTTANKLMLFIEIDNRESVNKVANNLQTNLSNIHNLIIKNTCSFIEKIGHINLPNNIIELLRQDQLFKIKEEIIYYTNNNTTKPVYRPYHLDYLIESKSVYLNMVKHKDKMIEVFNPKKYIAIS